MCPSLWEQQSPMYTLLPFDSLCEHMFSISVQSVSEMCDTRGEQGVWGGCMCGDGLPGTVYSGQHQLWIPACSQLPTCHLTNNFPPCITPPPCSLSQAMVGRTLQDFLDQTSSRDAGQVDSSSWKNKVWVYLS